MFCTNSRGVWYDRYVYIHIAGLNRLIMASLRLALNLCAHLKRNEESLQACIRGLSDPDVHARDGLLLQDRALKIASKEGLAFEKFIAIRDPKKVELISRVESDTERV